MTKQTIIIGLCTAYRPKMFADCMDSLQKQTIPEEAELTLVVVENTEKPLSQSVVEEYQQRFAYEIVYIHEPKKGIPIARNRVLDVALEQQADWVAYLDDDEIAAPNWIEELLQEAEYYKADVIQGQVKPLYPEPTPFWVIPHTEKLTQGEEINTAATNNLLFSKKLFSEWGLRFDEAMRFSGGEDTEYFNLAYQKGAKIIWSEKAVVEEFVPKERCSYGYILKRKIRCRNGDIRIRSKHFGRKEALRSYRRKFLNHLLKTIVRGVTLPFYLLLGMERFKRQALKLTDHLGLVIGYLSVICAFIPQPYTKIEGE